MRRHLVAAASVVVGAIGLFPAASLANTLFVPWSPFTVQGTNTPGTGTDAAVLLQTALPQVLLQTGLDLHVYLVDAGPNEWLVFHYNTLTGGPLASCVSCNWSISQNGLIANQAVDLVGNYIQFEVNGVAQPGNNTIGMAGPNPVPGMTGTGFVALGFVAPWGGPGPVADIGFSLNPFSFLASAGIADYADVNGFEQALEFAPQAPVPGPLAGAGLPGLLAAALGLLVWWRSRKSEGLTAIAA